MGTMPGRKYFFPFFFFCFVFLFLFIIYRSNSQKQKLQRHSVVNSVLIAISLPTKVSMNFGPKIDRPKNYGFI